MAQSSRRVSDFVSRGNTKAMTLEDEEDHAAFEEQ
jgi:hypothetical protein